MRPVRAATLCVAFVVFATSLPAQRPEPVELPRLLQLGPMPAGGAVMIFTKDGRLAKPKDQAEAPDSVLLRVDRNTPMHGVTKLLETLRATGTKRVQFAAQLPNGDAGCFTLALPASDKTVATVELRLHRERGGVPPTSVVPVLRRMKSGAHDEAFVVAIETPDDVSFETALRVLAAVQLAGVEHAVLRTNGEKGGKRPEAVGGGLVALADALGGSKAKDGDHDAPAIDLGPHPQIAFAPRVFRQDKPAVQATAVGCLERAPKGEAKAFMGGAGGRYGGRGGAGKIRTGFRENIQSGHTWLQQQQLPDGSFPGADGSSDLEGTALMMLALLGDGNTLQSGPNSAVLNRGIGWIVDQQREEGRIGDGGDDEVRLHGLATYALAEAYGLSNSSLLRPSLQDALRWLGTRQREDGGFGTERASDHDSTAAAMMALASGLFFGMKPPIKPTAVVTWFDLPANTETTKATETAAALFCRYFAGVDPKSTPAMPAAAKLLTKTAGAEAPWEAYWTTYALYQAGGRDWKTWSEKLASIAEEQVVAGEFAGSWDPAGSNSRVVTSALRMLTLQAFYRYTRIIR